ncbi:MAG: flagellar hook-length control protein FliK, partial [Halieaceae bacterium]|nr:flagellar hook-length control protein FliK [Halieaceae bacterium]
MSESIEFQLLTPAKALSRNSVKPEKTDGYETSGAAGGFAAVLDQQRPDQGEAARGGRGGPAAGGKDVPVGRQSDAAEGASATRPRTHPLATESPGAGARATPAADTAGASPDTGEGVTPGAVIAGSSSAGSEPGDPTSLLPASASEGDRAPGATLADGQLAPGAAGRVSATGADALESAASSARPTAGTVTGEQALIADAASPAAPDGATVATAATGTRVAGVEIDGAGPAGDVAAHGDVATGMRRGIADLPASPRPTPAAAASFPGPGEASDRSAASPGAATGASAPAAPLAPNAEAGDSLPAGPAPRAEPSLSLAAAAGMTPAAAAAAAQTAGSAPAEGDALVYNMDAAPEDAEFPGEMSSRVSLMLRDGSREARLQLHPAELGRVQVTINTDGDQARVVFVAESAAAREAIEQAM